MCIRDRATAQRFADEGATVVICDLNEEQGHNTVAAIGSQASFCLLYTSRCV